MQSSFIEDVAGGTAVNGRDALRFRAILLFMTPALAVPLIAPAHAEISSERSLPVVLAQMTLPSAAPSSPTPSISPRPPLIRVLPRPAATPPVPIQKPTPPIPVVAAPSPSVPAPDQAMKDIAQQLLSRINSLNEAVSQLQRQLSDTRKQLADMEDRQTKESATPAPRSAQETDKAIEKAIDDRVDQFAALLWEKTAVPVVFILILFFLVGTMIVSVPLAFVYRVRERPRDRNIEPSVPRSLRV
jgi:hypothetical protein